MIRATILALLGPFLCAPAFAAEPSPERPVKAIIRTSAGDLVLRLAWDQAPENCATFVRHVRDGVYAHTSFDDTDELAFFGGKPSQPIAGVASNGNMACDRGPVGEFQLPNKRGWIGFRRTEGSCNPDKRSNCTQIYVRFKDNASSDGRFTIFAAIEGDLKVVDTIHEKLVCHPVQSATLRTDLDGRHRVAAPVRRAMKSAGKYFCTRLGTLGRYRG